MKGDEQQFIKDFFDYYRTLRGYHERSSNSNGTGLATNPGPFMNIPIVNYVKEISQDLCCLLQVKFGILLTSIGHKKTRL